MKKDYRIVMLVLTLAGVFAACSIAKTFSSDPAKTRVENVLSGLTKDDMSNEYQTAICQWFDGSYTMSASDLESALNQFEAWQKKKGIKAPIGGYEIGKVEKESGGIPSWIVEVTIDGARHRIRVYNNEPLQWAD
jgi:hypothetical protein